MMLGAWRCQGPLAIIQSSRRDAHHFDIDWPAVSISLLSISFYIKDENTNIFPSFSLQTPWCLLKLIIEQKPARKPKKYY